jgi:hypothetical protein
MIGIFRTLALTVAAFGLFACNQTDKPSGPAPSSEATGSARIRLPSLPVGFQPDSTLDSNGNMIFQLTVTGAGMTPIRASWNLIPGHVEKVMLTDIPIGWPRVFTGRLIWRSAWGDSTVTHEGVDSAEISWDKIADVALYLRKIGSTGAAEVCVEVEGWHGDASCIKQPPFPIIDVSGCWQVAVRRVFDDWDTILRVGTLRIIQKDTALYGTITWASGQVENAPGVYYPGSTGLVKFGHEGMGMFYLKAYFDTIGAALIGDYRDSARTIEGGMHAFRIGCDSTWVPPEDTTVVPPVDSTLECYRTVQSFDDTTRGIYQTGLMLLKRDGGRTRRGWVKWDGYAEMRLTGAIDDSPADSQTIEFNGYAPAGMADSSRNGERFYYQGSYDPAKKRTIGGEFFRGTNRRNLLGSWKAAPVACRAQDSLAL